MTTAPGSRPVVVGVDGTALSREALIFALQEGVVRRVPVRVVTAWTFGTVLHDASFDATVESETEKVRAELDAEIVDALARTDARPEIEAVPVHGAHAEALVAAAQGACMLVVGSARKGPVARAVLGSTSEYCVRHSPVPVVVVPSEASL